MQQTALLDIVVSAFCTPLEADLMNTPHEHATSESLCIAAAQFSATTDIEENSRRIRRLSASAAQQGARAVVFPEAAMHAWNVAGEELATAARTHYRRFMQNLADTARALEITLVAGVFAPDHRTAALPRNRLAVFGPDGQPQGSYDKVHLYDAFAYRESDKVRAGETYADLSELCTVPIGSFTLGLLNCYDLRFPEMARALVDRGADVLAVSSAWVAGPNKEMHWETLLRARAIENTCYVIGSAQPPPESTGLSMIVDPAGLVASTCTTTEGLALHQLELRHLRSIRQTAPTLRHRRYAVVASSEAEQPVSAASRPGGVATSS